MGEVEYTARQDSSGNWCNDADETSPSSTIRIDPTEAVKSASSPTGLALASDPNIHVSARAHKMSKSRGNVVNPDDVVSEFGADSLRLYEMFMGPLRETKVRVLRGGWRGGAEKGERESFGAASAFLVLEERASVAASFFSQLSFFVARFFFLPLSSPPQLPIRESRESKERKKERHRTAARKKEDLPLLLFEHARERKK